MVAERLKEQIEVGKNLVTDSTDMTMAELQDLVGESDGFNTIYNAYLLGFARGHKAALLSECESVAGEEINYRAKIVKMLEKIKGEGNLKRIYRLAERIYIYVEN